MPKNEVAEIKKPLTPEAYDYGDDRGAGFEDVGLDDISIPFINSLQGLSPEVTENLIDGCRPGDLVNTVTKELVGQPIIVNPVHRECLWVEWIPRLKGGGFVTAHAPTSEVVLDVIRNNGGNKIPPKDSDGKRQPFKVGGNDLIQTWYWYCQILDETGTEKIGICVLSFTSTKIQVQKDWFSSLMQLRGAPPIWANRSVISTTPQRNASGQPFYNFKITGFDGSWSAARIPPSEEWGRELMLKGKDFRDMIQRGAARVATESLGGEDSDIIEGSTAGSTKRSGDGEDLPF